MKLVFPLTFSKPAKKLRFRPTQEISGKFLNLRDFKKKFEGRPIVGQEVLLKIKTNLPFLHRLNGFFFLLQRGRGTTFLLLAHITTDMAKLYKLKNAFGREFVKNREIQIKSSELASFYFYFRPISFVNKLKRS